MVNEVVRLEEWQTDTEGLTIDATFTSTSQPDLSEGILAYEARLPALPANGHLTLIYQLPGETTFRTYDSSDTPTSETVKNEATRRVRAEGIISIGYPASDFVPVTSGAIATRIVGSGNNRKGLRYVPFIPSVTTYATVSLTFLRDTVYRRFKAHIKWIAPTNPVNPPEAVIWEVAGVSVGDRDNLSGNTTNYGPGDRVRDVVANGNREQTTNRIVPVVLANAPRRGDTVYLRVSRRGSLTNDNYTDEAQLLSISLLENTS